MTVDDFADVVNLVGVVTRHKDNVRLDREDWLGIQVGIVEIDTESRDDALDDYLDNPTDTVSCQRINIQGGGYKYRIACPAWYVDFLFIHLVKGTNYDRD